MDKFIVVYYDIFEGCTIICGIFANNITDVINKISNENRYIDAVCKFDSMNWIK